MANDPVRLALTCTVLHFSLWKKHNFLSIWNDRKTLNNFLDVTSSVQVSGPPGRRCPRSICSQADEPEGKPRPLRPYDSFFIRGFFSLPLLFWLVTDVHQFTLCLPDNLMLPLTNYGIPWWVPSPLRSPCYGTPEGLKPIYLLRRSQHVDGLPGGRRGSHRVARPDGDVSDRETAQTGLSQPDGRTIQCRSGRTEAPCSAH